MKDRKGNAINVGNRVFVLPDGSDSNGAGYVRKIINGEAFVDDGPPGDFSILDDKEKYTWAAWCTSEEIEKI